MKRIVLASKSLDRGELFRRSNIRFEILITNINEEEYKNKISDPLELVKVLAQNKVESAQKKLQNANKDAIIIGADTIVEFEGEIIGKAKDEDEAFLILKKLSGSHHNLITGIAITDTEGSKFIKDSDTTIVNFLPLSDNEIKNYLKSNEWKGRAGAYSIRDKASLFIESINGSPSNVIGLPMQKIFDILKREFNINLLDS